MLVEILVIFTPLHTDFYSGLADCKSRGDLSLWDRLRRRSLTLTEHWFFPNHSTNKNTPDKRGISLGWATWKPPGTLKYPIVRQRFLR